MYGPLPKKLVTDWCNALSNEAYSLINGIAYYNHGPEPCFCAVGALFSVPKVTLYSSGFPPSLRSDTRLRKALNQVYDHKAGLGHIFYANAFTPTPEEFYARFQRERTVFEQVEYLFETLHYTREQLIAWIQENVVTEETPEEPSPGDFERFIESRNKTVKEEQLA